MTLRTKRNSDLAADLDLLIGALCTNFGFCNRLWGDDFARAVLEAAKMDPATNERWRAQFEKQFSLRYGRQLSRASYARQ